MRTAAQSYVPLIRTCNHTVHDLHRINNTDVAREQMKSIATVLASYTEAISRVGMRCADLPLPQIP